MAWGKTGIVTACVLGGGIYGVLAFALRPATPPLLKGIRSAGGWNSSGCPPSSPFDRPEREALSLDLMSRLTAAFPPGSDPAALRAMLLDQGFRLIDPCKQDAAIHRAWFTQEGGGPFGPFPISALVAWRIGPDGRIEWTKALVSFTGL